MFPLVLGESDNRKTNKPHLKNMVYYVVKHSPKYVYHTPVTTPLHTWSEVDHPKNTSKSYIFEI